jgi:hypothetical protein
MIPDKRGTRGLTLVEIIVTIGILGTFMTLLSFHMVGLANLWLNRGDDDFFEQHVDGVVLFLNKALEAAESASQANNQEEGGSQPVEWARPPGWSELDDPLLHFRQAEAPALFVREGESLPAIFAYLHFDDRDGLSVLWYSDLDGEAIEQVRDLYRTPISPFITELEYAYYDLEDDTWEITRDPLEERNETFVLPDYLRLTFTHPEQGERVRSIFIPRGSLEIPLF